MKRRNLLLSIAGSATLLALSAAPGVASAQGNNPYAPVTVYFTRHAEKQTEQMELAEEGKYMDICGVSKCAEEINAEGRLRARLLASWFQERGITGQLTHAFSSHKQRTRQTIEPTVANTNLTGDVDLMSDDGIQQLPADGTELAPESTSSSVSLTVAALAGLPGGSTALVAGHSGTIYKIMDDFGIDTSSPTRFPRDAKGKVRDFGDIWKMVIQSNGQAQVHWKVNLQPTRLTGTWQ